MIEGRAVIDALVSYVCGPDVADPDTVDIARLCLADALGCALLATRHPACTRHVGVAVPGGDLVEGSRVPGSKRSFDPLTATAAIGSLVRWLDYNDTWLGREWGHPSDNWAGLLAVGDYLCRSGTRSVTMGEVLQLGVKAYEVQGALALGTNLNRRGLDHVVYVRVASAAVVTRLLGGGAEAVASAVTNAWADGAPLRLYRQGGHAGERKSWAAGDAASRGVYLAYLASSGEPGQQGVLDDQTWGFSRVLLGDDSVRLLSPLGSAVVDGILFKVSFPVEFFAQTAVEAALALHPLLGGRPEEIDRISIDTTEPALRLIDRRGPLLNAADRDHCLQYAVAVALLTGNLTHDSFADEAAADERIDGLRGRTDVRHEPAFTALHDDPEQRAVPNRVTVFLRDGTRLGPEEVLYPLGHPRRRDEARPLLQAKLVANLTAARPDVAWQPLLDVLDDLERLAALPVDRLMGALTATPDGLAALDATRES